MLTRRLTNSNFLTFAQLVAAPSKPEDYNPAAVKRLMEYLTPYIVDVKGIRFKHHAKNKIELINFSTPEERQAYENAWEDYQKKLALLENKDISGSRFMILVEFLKFRQAAELIRAPYLARRLYEIRNVKGKSAVCAVNFRETIAKITSILVNDYAVPRNKISLIWGGQSEKAKKKTAISADKLEEMEGIFSPEDLAFLREQGLISEEEQAKEDSAREERQTMRERLRLGTQSQRQRQEEIDRFQLDESDYCLFTFKSGGVGLSLHQEKPTFRPRESLIAPTYSAIELVQGLGRTARFTSCSDTDQTIVFYAGTIEVRVAARVSAKLKCLREVVRQQETWESVILGERPREEEPSEKEFDEKDEKPRTVELASDDEDSLVGGEVEDENEEEEQK